MEWLQINYKDKKAQSTGKKIVQGFSLTCLLYTDSWQQFVIYIITKYFQHY